jgi:NAD+ synthase
MINIDQLNIDPVKTTLQVTEFINKVLKSTNLKNVIVSVSGGIDSAVALSSSTKAIGPQNVIALTLPECDITPKEDVEDVMQLCEMIGVTCEQIEITNLLHVIRENIPEFDPTNRVAYGNMKARLRMLITYYYANIKKALVVGTSNKTELYLGYYTKYGDGGVDIMPLADLYKCQVRAIGMYLGLPDNIIRKPASARLWANQDTETELGISYDNLDLIVYAHTKGWSPSKIAAETGIKKSKIVEIVNRIAVNEHKRVTPAILRLS